MLPLQSSSWTTTREFESSLPPVTSWLSLMSSTRSCGLTWIRVARELSLVGLMPMAHQHDRPLVERRGSAFIGADLERGDLRVDHLLRACASYDRRLGRRAGARGGRNRRRSASAGTLQKYSAVAP